MGELEVQIVELEPIRVASFLGYGPEPEGVALDKLVAWAGPRGLLENWDEQRVYGFNNPNPSPGSPNYGYEFWIVVGSDVKAEEGYEIKEFAGGRYAVTRCVGVESIGPTWQVLAAWLHDSPHGGASHQWLERALSPAGTPLDKIALDLYAPIAG